MPTQAGAPEHTDNQIDGAVASFCTMDNVQYYTLSPTRGKEPVYALIIISSVSKPGGKLMYMLDKVAKVEDKSTLPDLIHHLKKLSWISTGMQDGSASTKSRTFSPSSDHTPYKVKKARTLSAQPTDVSLPEPAALD